MEVLDIGAVLTLLSKLTKTQSRNKRKREKAKREAKEKEEEKKEEKPKVELPSRVASQPYVCPGKLGAKWDDKKKSVQ